MEREHCPSPDVKETMKRERENRLNTWRKIPKNDLQIAETYLRNRENYCVAASARFIGIQKSLGHIWYLGGLGSAEEISALLLHSRRTLFPVFNKKTDISSPDFLTSFLRKTPVHAIQGLREDIELLEPLLEKLGYFHDEHIDYCLLNIDVPPGPEVLRAGPANLILREPAAGDEEELFALQSAYEREEVLPKSAVFNPASTRLNLKHILSSEYMLIAELNGQVVGKINTSAESFTRFQIGGVYVRPDCRGRGIGLKMTSVFTGTLLARGKGLTLFVKNRNAAARAVYRRAGFTVLADYRITYY